MLFAARCPCCLAIGPAPCAACRARLRPAPRLAVPAGLDGLHALVAYEGPGRDLVLSVKYRNHRDAVSWLGERMAALASVAPGDDPDLVTWAPTTPARRRARGFDQADALARVVAASLRIPCRPLLRRRPGPPQTGRPPRERRTGPEFTAPRSARGVVARATDAAGRAPVVLLVDDVVTTGATLGRAARVLRGSGCGLVVGLVAAGTLLKPPRSGAEHWDDAGE